MEFFIVNGVMMIMIDSYADIYMVLWTQARGYCDFSCSIVSLVGNGFFSCVSVFFNFDLSKVFTSLTSGLSDMVMNLQQLA